MRHLYEILNVPPGAPHTAIQNRYRELARSAHPDLGGDHDEFTSITNAGAVLLDPDRRREYDAWMALMLEPCPKCEGKGCIFMQVSFTTTNTRRCPVCKGQGYHEKHR